MYRSKCKSSLPTSACRLGSQYSVSFVVGSFSEKKSSSICRLFLHLSCLIFFLNVFAILWRDFKSKLWEVAEWNLLLTTSTHLHLKHTALSWCCILCCVCIATVDFLTVDSIPWMQIWSLYMLHFSIDWLTQTPFLLFYTIVSSTIKALHSLIQQCFEKRKYGIHISWRDVLMSIEVYTDCCLSLFNYNVLIN